MRHFSNIPDNKFRDQNKQKEIWRKQKQRTETTTCVCACTHTHTISTAPIKQEQNALQKYSEDKKELLETDFIKMKNSIEELKIQLRKSPRKARDGK